MYALLNLLKTIGINIYGNKYEKLFVKKDGNTSAIAIPKPPVTV